jgi:hypothetical protein
MSASKSVLLGKQVASLSALLCEAEARSLELLKTIDETIDTLAWYTRHMDADRELIERTVALINNSGGLSVRLDADGRVCESLESVQAAVLSMHEDMVAKRDAARRACELREEDGVVEAYDEVIQSAADLHDAVNTVRWCIREHDADQEERGPRKSYSAEDIDSLIADLKVG